MFRSGISGLQLRKRAQGAAGGKRYLVGGMDLPREMAYQNKDLKDLAGSPSAVGPPSRSIGHRHAMLAVAVGNTTLPVFSFSVVRR